MNVNQSINQGKKHPRFVSFILFFMNSNFETTKFTRPGPWAGLFDFQSSSGRLGNHANRYIT